MVNPVLLRTSNYCEKCGRGKDWGWIQKSELQHLVLLDAFLKPIMDVVYCQICINYVLDWMNGKARFKRYVNKTDRSTQSPLEV